MRLIHAKVRILTPIFVDMEIVDTHDCGAVYTLMYVVYIHVLISL